jgi:hypothetical protein
MDTCKQLQLVLSLFEQPESRSPSVLLSRLDFHLRTLIQKDEDVEKARQQVTKDVESLIL